MALYSILTRTAFDCLIILALAYSVSTVIRNYHVTKRIGFGFVASFVLIGLVLISLVYIADLVTIFALPLLTSPTIALDIMTDLSLSANKMGMVIAVGALVGCLHLLHSLIPPTVEFIDNLAKNGEELALGIIKRKNDDSDGKPLCSIGTMMNVTEQQRMEDELIRLERINARVELISGLNHNFNNLLNGFIAPAEALMTSEQTEENRRWAEIILTTSQNAAALMKRLNDVIHVSEEPLQSVDINSCIHLSLKAVQARWREDVRVRNIKLKVVTKLRSAPPGRCYSV